MPALEDGVLILRTVYFRCTSGKFGNPIVESKLVRSLARRLEVGIGPGDKCHRGDVTGIRLIAAAPIDTPVRVKGAGNAAVVVHDDVGILPLPSQFDRWTVIVCESAYEAGPVIHVQTDLFAVGVRADTTPHASSEMHVEGFSTRRTEIGGAADRRSRHDPAAGRAGLETDVDDIPSAFGGQSSPALPVRDDMEPATKKESPRREDCRDEESHSRTQSEQKHEPREAAETTRASSPSVDWSL